MAKTKKTPLGAKFSRPIDIEIDKRVLKRLTMRLQWMIMLVTSGKIKK